jgi:hypothetical protein
LQAALPVPVVWENKLSLTAGNISCNKKIAKMEIFIFRFPRSLYNRPALAKPNKKRADFPKFFLDSLPPGSPRSRHADDFFFGRLTAYPVTKTWAIPGECQ